MTDVKIGDTYGKLTVVEYAGERVRVYGKKRRCTYRMKLFACRCFCGKVTTVLEDNLVRGISKTCGCQRMANMKAAITTHNLSKSAECCLWRKTKDKCYNPKNPDYRYYGGRGIFMDETWRNSFEAFYRGIGPRPTPKHTLDRIDVNGNYEPGNVRWATRRVQSLNTRRTEMTGIFIRYGKYRLKYKGKNITVVELEEAKRLRDEDFKMRWDEALAESERLQHK